MSQTQQQQNYLVSCEICLEDIELGPNTIQHELIECITCGTEWEVVSLDPLEIEEAPMEAEDWGQ